MGGVGWGNNVHVTSRSSQVEDSWTLCSAFRGGWVGVGWGNNVHVTSRSSQVEDFWTLCSQGFASLQLDRVAKAHQPRQSTHLRTHISLICAP